MISFQSYITGRTVFVVHNPVPYAYLGHWSCCIGAFQLFTIWGVILFTIHITFALYWQYGMFYFQLYNCSTIQRKRFCTYRLETKHNYASRFTESFKHNSISKCSMKDRTMLHVFFFWRKNRLMKFLIYRLNIQNWDRLWKRLRFSERETNELLSFLGPKLPLTTLLNVTNEVRKITANRSNNVVHSHVIYLVISTYTI